MTVKVIKSSRTAYTRAVRERFQKPAVILSSVMASSASLRRYSSILPDLIGREPVLEALLIKGIGLRIDGVAVLLLPRLLVLTWSVFTLRFLFHIPKLVSGGKGKHKKVRNQAIADKLVYNCIPLYSTVYYIFIHIYICIFSIGCRAYSRFG